MTQKHTEKCGHAASTVPLYRGNLDQCLRYNLVPTVCNDAVSTGEVGAIWIMTKRQDAHERRAGTYNTEQKTS